MPVLEDIAIFLAAQGLGTVKTSLPQTSVPWLIYKAGTPPGDRQDAISLTSYPGGPPLEVMGVGAGAIIAEEVRFQVLARHMVYPTAAAKAENLWSSLHGYSGTPVATRYLRIVAKTSPYPVGRDEATRYLYGFDCIATKERG